MDDKYVERPWFRLYDIQKTPETLEPYPKVSYTEYCLDMPAKKYPNNLALVQFDYEMTFRELKEKVDRFATALADLGIKKGDVVATVLPTSIQFMISDFAIAELGAIHLSASILDSVDGLADKFTRADVKTVISVHTNVKDGDIIDKVKKASEKANIKDMILTHTEDFSSDPPKHKEEAGITWFTDLIEKYPPNPPNVHIDPKKDVLLLSFTGGTTGDPKGAMLSHYGLVAVITSCFGSLMPQSVVSLLKRVGLPVRIIMPSPLFHIYGHGITPAFLAFGSAVLLQKDPRDIKEIIRLAKRYHPLLCAGTPTYYMKLLKEKKANNLGMILASASMAIAPEVQKGVEKKTGSIVGEAYGLSEIPITHFLSMASVLLPVLGSMDTVKKVFGLLDRMASLPGLAPLIGMAIRMVGPDRLGSFFNTLIAFISKNMITTPSGRKKELTGSAGMPMPDVKVKIVDEDTGETIPMEKVIKEGKRGEMCLDAPWKMLGYWPDVGSGLDEEGFVHTGDVVRLDEWGRTYIVDRTKDMVNVSGYKVYTREIDDLLYGLEGIDEVATVGIPDPERPESERIKVFAVPLPAYKGKINEEDIINYLKGKVAPYAVPKSVEIREDIPKTVAEKIFKQRLRDEEMGKRIR
ncbi:MAG: long-chain fatty acid--CoA ligase, FadD-like protein [Candidatus Methanolliviera sp. GoM_oil]|nr:MAG: long-chain fatty acid--CoA ligase, FadD-like protein [Candidatus Methanolliviera sp. GoM_oil]